MKRKNTKRMVMSVLLSFCLLAVLLPASLFAAAESTPVNLLTTNSDLKRYDVTFEGELKEYLFDASNSSITSEDKHSGSKSLKTATYCVGLLNPQPYQGKMLTFGMWVKGTKGRTISMEFLDEEATFVASKQVEMTGEWQHVTLVADIPSNFTHVIKFGIQALNFTTYTDDWELYEGDVEAIVNPQETLPPVVIPTVPPTTTPQKTTATAAATTTMTAAAGTSPSSAVSSGVDADASGTFPGWAIILIVVVVLAAAGATVALVLVNKKKADKENPDEK